MTSSLEESYVNNYVNLLFITIKTFTNYSQSRLRQYSMPPTLELVGRHPITIESAIEEERNVIHWASNGPATDKLYQALWEQRELIGALVKYYLALGKQDACIMLPPSH